jgi:hypothetical protein
MDLQAVVTATNTKKKFAKVVPSELYDHEDPPSDEEEEKEETMEIGYMSKEELKSHQRQQVESHMAKREALKQRIVAECLAMV